VHRSNAASGRAVCFLGRFLPKLGGPTRVAIFLPVAPLGGERPAPSIWTGAIADSRCYALSVPELRGTPKQPEPLWDPLSGSFLSAGSNHYPISPAPPAQERHAPRLNTLGAHDDDEPHRRAGHAKD
jgi:hypothetical protein